MLNVLSSLSFIYMSHNLESINCQSNLCIVSDRMVSVPSLTKRETNSRISRNASEFISNSKSQISGFSLNLHIFIKKIIIDPLYNNIDPVFLSEDRKVLSKQLYLSWNEYVRSLHNDGTLER